jgi:broad specificity phosphatase PhoE
MVPSRFYAHTIDQLIICRHAESFFNVRGVLNADPSVPGGLSDRGRRQARELGDRLAADPIDLCVTTDLRRTIETADLALEGRAVPRLVIPELNDPPNGVFELRPAEEFHAWRRAHGPDDEIPGTGITDRQAVERIRAGLVVLATRPEPTVLAILHGWFVGWVLASAGVETTWRTDPVVPFHLSADVVAEVLAATAEDVFARYDLP